MRIFDYCTFDICTYYFEMKNKIRQWQSTNCNKEWTFWTYVLMSQHKIDGNNELDLEVVMSCCSIKEFGIYFVFHFKWQKSSLERTQKPLSDGYVFSMEKYYLVYKNT